MPQRQILGFIGSLILFVGVFTPILNVPIVGSINYFQNGKGDGVIILVLAVISFFLTLAQKYKALLITGFGSLALLAFTFVNFQLRMSDARAEMERNLANNPFRGLGDAMVSSVQISWGWAVLIIGAGFVIAAAFETLNFFADDRPLFLIVALVGFLAIGFGISFFILDYTLFNNSNLDNFLTGLMICSGIALIGYSSYSIWKE
jgi:hypothetical protein